MERYRKFGGEPIKTVFTPYRFPASDLFHDPAGNPVELERKKQTGLAAIVQAFNFLSRK